MNQHFIEVLLTYSKRRMTTAMTIIRIKRATSTPTMGPTTLLLLLLPSPDIDSDMGMPVTVNISATVELSWITIRLASLMQIYL